MEKKFLKLGCSAKAQGKLGEQMNDLLERSNLSKNLEKFETNTSANICKGEREDVIGGVYSDDSKQLPTRDICGDSKCLFSVMGGAGMLAGISKGDP